MIERIEFNEDIVKKLLLKSIIDSTTIKQDDITIEITNNNVINVIVFIKNITLNLNNLGLDIQKIIYFYLKKELDVNPSNYKINVYFDRKEK